MELRPQALIVAASLFVCMTSHAATQQSYAAGNAAVASPAQSSAAGGILMNRLSRSDRRIWSAIIEIVLVKDQHGQPKHPGLYDLWQKLESSGHAVFIELVDREWSYSGRAGQFIIEAFDPNGKHHICTIKLNLSAIRRTYTKSSCRSDGFIPMAGLGDRARYAEVLGHEMAHAVGILLDQDYLQLYRELEKEVAEYESLLNNPAGRPDALDRQLNRIKILQEALERPAMAAEGEIWRELQKTRK